MRFMLYLSCYKDEKREWPKQPWKSAGVFGLMCLRNDGFLVSQLVGEGNRKLAFLFGP